MSPNSSDMGSFHNFGLCRMLRRLQRLVNHFYVPLFADNSMDIGGSLSSKRGDV